MKEKDQVHFEHACAEAEVALNMLAKDGLSGRVMLTFDVQDGGISQTKCNEERIRKVRR